MNDIGSILRRLAESQDRGMLNRRLHIFRVNNRDRQDIQRCLDYAERMLRIRR